MKRIFLSILLILSMAFGPFCFAEVAPGVVGNLDDFEVNYIGEAAIAITKYTGNEPNLIIPPVEEMTARIKTSMDIEVTTLASESFAYNNALEVLRIPEGYEYIRYQAFYGCENLTTIFLPSTLDGIDYEAFANCTSLTNIYFPQGANLRYIDETAFSGCTLLELTQEDIDQMLDTGYFEALAEKERQQAEFVVDENALTELSGYLGTDIDAFGPAMNAAEYNQSDRWGFANDDVCATSIYSWKYIEELELRQKCNYTLCGVYVSMDAKEARSALLKSGWKITDQTSTYVNYEDADGNWLSLSLDASGAVTQVYLAAGGSNLDRLADGRHDGSPMIGAAPAASAAAYGEAPSEASSMQARTTAKVNMRTGAGLGFDTIGSIPGSTTVEYLGEESTDDRGVVWYHVRYNGNDGWCSSKYIELQ